MLSALTNLSINRKQIPMPANQACALHHPTGVMRHLGGLLPEFPSSQAPGMRAIQSRNPCPEVYTLFPFPAPRQGQRFEGNRVMTVGPAMLQRNGAPRRYDDVPLAAKLSRSGLMFLASRGLATTASLSAPVNLIVLAQRSAKPDYNWPGYFASGSFVIRSSPKIPVVNEQGYH